MTMAIVFVLIFLSLQVSKSQCLNPVLLVPGDGGSIINARNIKPPPHYICGECKNWFVLWLNVFYVTPITLRCFVETIKLDYNPVNRTTSSPEFCETKVNGFGTSDSVEYFSSFRLKSTSYFHYVIDNLVRELGYIRNKNIRGAPYDFRKAPNEMRDFQNNVRHLIEQMYSENGNSSVIIVAHSMGNMYIIRLLNVMTQLWKDKYIKYFISISPPYSGAVDAVRTALSGNNERIFLLPPLDLRAAQSTWPSTYYLMPIASMWSSEPIAATDQGNFTAFSIPELLKTSEIPYAQNHWMDIAFIAQIPSVPNVPVYCIYSDNVPTPEFIDYRGGQFPNNKPKITHGPGDGTVNLQSLRQCTAWGKVQTQPVTTAIIPGVKHLEIMRDKRLIDLVTEIVKDSKSPGLSCDP